MLLALRRMLGMKFWILFCFLGLGGFMAWAGLVPLDLGESAITPYLPFAHIAIGTVLALLFCWTFRLTTFVRMAAMALGLFVMVNYHVELVHNVPKVYVKFFSKPYVKAIRAEARAAAAEQA